MSCFIVSDEHISAILGAAHALHRRHRITHYPDSTGQLLLDENVKSWECRYGSHKDPRPSKFVLCEDLYRNPPECIAVLKLIKSLKYQSSNHQGWRDSVARATLEEITDALVTALPGYTESPWSI